MTSTSSAACASAAVASPAAAASARKARADHASAATRTEIIRSGRAGGSPRVIASTCSMPLVTRPQTVYWPFRKWPSSNMMKNCELPLFGFCDRAMPTDAAVERQLARTRPAGRAASSRRSRPGGC